VEKQYKILDSHMATPVEKQDVKLMQEMFGRIAPRYDFVTRTFSYGMDLRWKRLGVERAKLPANAMVLDLASGTGDFSQLVAEQLPQARVVGVDLTEEMLHAARKRGMKNGVCGDATSLPFADGTFDCVFIGYGLRNFPCLDTALREIERVTRPAGLLVTLDFFLPANRVFREAYLAYLYAQGALWGMLLHGKPRTYTYIPDSLRNFISMDQFSAALDKTGYTLLNARGFILGGIGLHWAAKR
jgi:demethylmenaquinone methyltransferase/2-methoxy-6-polyprenyl-1,4-benzoquinol methylase